MTVTPSEARAPDGTPSKKEAAGQAAEAAGQAAANVKDTAKDQARRVTGEASTQARNVASEVKGKVSGQVQTQNDKLVDGIRRLANELDEMRADRQDGPAAAVVTRVADGGRQVADYLANRGPDGVLREVQEFARRRPGAFLATALATGFVVGRLGKGVMNAADSPGSAKPSTDSFVSTTPQPDLTYSGTRDPAYSPGYAADEPLRTDAGTEYAATGTGTPVAVTDPFDPDTDPEGRPR